MRARRSLYAIALWLGCVGPAFAGTDSDTMVVSATVLATCEVSAGDLDFGDYDPLAPAALDAATTLSLACTNGTAYELAMSVDGGESTAGRFMYDGAEQLAYVLYQDPARTVLWGQNNSVDTLSGTGTGSAVTIDVYGRIPMQQAAPAGDYTDTITVTVTW